MLCPLYAIADSVKGYLLSSVLCQTPTFLFAHVAGWSVEISILNASKNLFHLIHLIANMSARNFQTELL